MLIEMNGKDYDCKLVKMEFAEDGSAYVSDNRALNRCIPSANCATCMWNREYAEKHVKKLEIRKMPKKQLDALKKRNKFYPITAKTLNCLQQK